MAECTCTSPVHGGKKWLCLDPKECDRLQKPIENSCRPMTEEEKNRKSDPFLDYDVLDEDHPNTCRCEVCRFWGA